MVFLLQKIAQFLFCDLDDKVMRHSFLVSQNCPVNLMGRDLMCSFDIVLSFAPDGIKVLKKSQLPLYQMVKCGSDTLLYAHELKLEAHRVSSDLTNFARTHSIAADNYVHGPSLHCTSYVSIGPNRKYEKVWYVEVESENLMLKHVYWTEKVAVQYCCCICISYTISGKCFFRGFAPHISLAKQAVWKWQDMGPCLHNCLRLIDFELAAEDPKIFILCIYRMYIEQTQCWFKDQ